MLHLFASLNAVLASVVDVLLWPLTGLPPVAGLAVVSLVTAIVILSVVRRTSDQKALDRVKRQIHAALFEIRLFNDDLRAIVRAQGEMLRHNLTYLRLSLVPMLWMIVPFALIVAQLQFHYGYAGLETGRPVLVTAHLRESPPRDATDAVRASTAAGAPGADIASLDVPQGLRADTHAIWFPASQEVVWRITPEREGDYELRLTVAGQTFTKSIRVSPRVVRRSPSRLETGFVNALLYPAEAPLPSGAPVTSIVVAYPDRETEVLGWRVNWIVVFFVLSIAFAFALRKPFGVTL